MYTLELRINECHLERINATAKDNFIAFLSYEIERLSFLRRPYRVSAFGALHHLQASNKHSVVCHL